MWSEQLTASNPAWSASVAARRRALGASCSCDAWKPTRVMAGVRTRRGVGPGEGVAEAVEVGALHRGAVRLGLGDVALVGIEDEQLVDLGADDRVQQPGRVTEVEVVLDEDVHQEQVPHPKP